jgi:hypothetical protein
MDPEPEMLAEAALQAAAAGATNVTWIEGASEALPELKKDLRQTLQEIEPSGPFYEDVVLEGFFAWKDRPAGLASPR